MSQSIFRTVVRGVSAVRLASGPSVRLQTVPKRMYADVPPPPDCIFRPLLDYRTFTYTYLLADSASREAVIIDPVYEQAERDVKLVHELGLKLLYGINTHMHADHVTGTGMIKRQIPTCKSVISKHTEAKADVYVDNGELIKFGKFSLECRTTPGHTDSCISYVWHEKGMVFSGDTLLIRKCGRTDFQQGFYGPDAVADADPTALKGTPTR